MLERKELYVNGLYRPENPKEVANYCGSKMGIEEGSAKWEVLASYFKDVYFKCARIEDGTVSLSAMTRQNQASTLCLDAEDMLKLFVLYNDFALTEAEWKEVESMKVFGDTTVCYLKTGEKGVARLIEGDHFDVGIGHRIAYNKAVIKQAEKNLRKAKRETKEAIKKFTAQQQDSLKVFKAHTRRVVADLRSQINEF